MPDYVIDFLPVVAYAVVLILILMMFIVGYVEKRKMKKRKIVTSRYGPI